MFISKLVFDFFTIICYNFFMDDILKIVNAQLKYKANDSFLRDKTEYIHVLNNVNLKIKRGEILSLVGESGCGKTTLGKSILKLLNLNNGNIFFNGEDIEKFSKKQLFEYRKQVQIIFQNPYASLNPKMTVYDILKEPLDVHKWGNKQEIQNRIYEICKLTGIDLKSLNRYSSEFSGGQRQRIAIARSLVLNPQLIIADEPVSALDVSIQAQIINLLLDLKNKLNLTILFISHDLSVVKYISNYVAIMYLGQIIEFGKKDEIFNNYKHPYTKALMDSIPKIDNNLKEEKNTIQGEIPSLKTIQEGCKFFSRCPYSLPKCKDCTPSNIYISNSHYVNCFLYDVY